jgi:sporulation protein YabP
MIDQMKTKLQEFLLMNRKHLEITGVVNVDSFDSEEFLLETECGFLTVRGQNLHMKNLSLEQGLVAIEGSVNALQYLDGNSLDKSKGFLGKLFK